MAGVEILLVDNSIFLKRLLERRLREFYPSLKIIQVESIERAYEVLKASRMDLIICDELAIGRSALGGLIQVLEERNPTPAILYFLEFENLDSGLLPSSVSYLTKSDFNYILREILRLIPQKNLRRAQ